MEASNEGAFQAGGNSVGCNIILPKEQAPNPYLHTKITIPYFFVRKVLLIKYSYAFIVMPGGLGTLDEFFESLLLIQIKIINRFPVVLFGKEYHKDLITHINRMHENKNIDETDIQNLLITDSVEEMTEYLKGHSIIRYKLVNSYNKAKWWIGGRFEF